MTDVSDRVRRELERLEPSPGGFEKTLRRAQRRERNRRITAAALSLVLTAGVAVGLWFSFQGEQRRIIGSPSPQSRRIVGSPSLQPRLFLAGDGEMWTVDVGGTVRRRELSELTPGDPPYRIVRRGNKLVLWGYKTYVMDSGPTPRPEVLVEDSLAFVPSAAEDRVWVAVGGTDLTQVEALREVSIDGRVTVPDFRPPRGAFPVAALENHLVFEVDGTLEVWDWSTQSVVRRLPGQFVLASHGNLLAWCADRCDSVHVTDVTTGKDSEIFPPLGSVGFHATGGAFSPDGKTIAVPVCTYDPPRPKCKLGLIDVRTGKASSVNGTDTHDYIYIEWSPSGDAVYISGGERLAERFIIEYRLDSAAGRRLPIEVGDFYGMAAVLVPGSDTSMLPCTAPSEAVKQADTQVGQWLLAVLGRVGAPEAQEVRPEFVTERHGDFVLNVPAYRKRFEFGVFAEAPEPDTVSGPLEDMPLIARTEGFELRGSGEVAPVGFQQFIVAGEDVWIGVHVFPNPERLRVEAITAWFRELAHEIRRSPPPPCLQD